MNTVSDKLEVLSFTVGNERNLFSSRKKLLIINHYLNKLNSNVDECIFYFNLNPIISYTYTSRYLKMFTILEMSGYGSDAYYRYVNKRYSLG